MIEIDLSRAEIKRVDAGNNFFGYRKQPLDSISVSILVNGFEKDFTLKDRYFDRIMEVIHQQVIRNYEDGL